MALRSNILARTVAGANTDFYNPFNTGGSIFNLPTPTNPTATPGGLGTDVPWWVYLADLGIKIATPFLQPTGQQYPQLPGGQVGGAGVMTMAQVIAALAALGIRVVGTVIRTSRGLWARVPDYLKTAALALGLTTLFDDDGEGNGMKKRRAKGITGAELRGFNKVGRLMKRWGMRPKVLGGYSRRRVCK